MKIEKGQKYLCVEQTLGSLYEIGRIYKSLEDGTLHLKGIGNQTVASYNVLFQPLSSAKWAIKRTPENADELDKWVGCKVMPKDKVLFVSQDKMVSYSFPPENSTEIDLTTFREVTGSGEDQKIYTIEDVRNGKCAIENDGTEQDIKTVVKYIFGSTPLGAEKFYFKDVTGYGWESSSETDLPTQSVKLFLSQIEGEKEDNKYLEAHTSFHNQMGDYIVETTEEWQPKWGEEVEVSDGLSYWQVENFFCLNPDKDSEFKYFVMGQGNSADGWKMCRPLEIHTFTTEQAKQDLAKLHNLNVNQIKIVE